MLFGSASGCTEGDTKLSLEEIRSPIIPELESPTWCSGTPMEPLGIELPVMLFVGEGVPLSAVRESILAAESILRTYGIQPVFDPEIRQIPRNTLFTIDPTKLRRAIQKGTPQPRLEAMLLGGVKVLLQTHCRPRTAGTHWFFLDEIAPETGIASRILGEVLGIGLSPELVAAEQDAGQGGSWVQAAGLGGEFTPTLVLGTRAIGKKDRMEAGLTIFHELGHAMGLGHAGPDSQDLMGTALPKCLPTLTDDEKRAFVSGGGNAK